MRRGVLSAGGVSSRVGHVTRRLRCSAITSRQAPPSVASRPSIQSQQRQQRGRFSHAQCQAPSSGWSRAARRAAVGLVAIVGASAACISTAAAEESADSSDEDRKSFGRFRYAHDRTFRFGGYAIDRGAVSGSAESDEALWQGPFYFIQLADTQFGMYTHDRDWTEEERMATQAANAINRMQPRPRFVAMCGDLVNAAPPSERKDADSSRQQDLYEAQTLSFRRILSQVKADIPLVCLCGNHDVGNTPSAASIAEYRSRFGDDYFEFMCGGVHFISLNSQLYKDATGDKAASLAAEQDQWLQRVTSSPLYSRDSRDVVTPTHRVVFSHIPPFIYDPNEREDYFNFDVATRMHLLDTMKGAGVSKWFCGHFHRNAGGWSDSLEVVITSAVGVQLQDQGNPLGLPIKMVEPAIGESVSGLRVVRVRQEDITHKWCTLNAVPTEVDLQPLPTDSVQRQRFVQKEAQMGWQGHAAPNGARASSSS